MTQQSKNTSSPSTTWKWKRVRIAPAPQASTNSRPKGDYSHRLARRNPREPLTLTVVYRGGPECWWEIRGRGVTIRRPGSTALHDVLDHLTGRD